jgi:cell division septation protein DedD
MTEYGRQRRVSNDSESFFCRFTFGQFFALLVLEVFTLFFVFYLGARYGREFLGLDRAPSVAVVGGETQRTEAKVTTTDDPEAREIAKDLIEKAQTPELKERIARMLESDAPKAPQQETSATEGPPQRSAAPVESSPMPFRSPERAGEEAQASVIRVKSAENARYSIQVGSYQQMSDANGKLKEWKERGYPSYVMIADIPNRGRWYRVRIGGFATRADASRYLAKLRTKENVGDALIVLNEQ